MQLRLLETRTTLLACRVKSADYSLLKKLRDMRTHKPVSIDIRMNAVGLIELGVSSHTLEQEWNHGDVQISGKRREDSLEHSAVVTPIVRW